jgi:hypothetical protein
VSVQTRKCSRRLGFGISHLSDTLLTLSIVLCLTASLPHCLILHPKATVVASGGPLSVLKMARKDFTRVLGPLVDIMNRNIGTYKVRYVPPAHAWKCAEPGLVFHTEQLTRPFRFISCYLLTHLSNTDTHIHSNFSDCHCGNKFVRHIGCT